MPIALRSDRGVTISRSGFIHGVPSTSIRDRSLSPECEDDSDSSSSSSIGMNSDSFEDSSDHEDSDEAEVQSSLRGPLETVNTLEEGLPGNETPEEHNPSVAIARSKKRKRNSVHRDEFLLQGMERIANTLVEGLKEASEQLAIHMNRDEREKRLDDMKNSLYDDIMQVEGLSDQQRDSAYIKLMSDEKLLIAFYAAPQEAKARLLCRMIA